MNTFFIYTSLQPFPSSSHTSLKDLCVLQVIQPVSSGDIATLVDFFAEDSAVSNHQQGLDGCRESTKDCIQDVLRSCRHGYEMDCGDRFSRSVMCGWARGKLKNDVAMLLLGFYKGNIDIDEDDDDSAPLSIWQENHDMISGKGLHSSGTGAVTSFSTKFCAFLDSGDGDCSRMRKVYCIPSKHFVAIMRRGLLRAYRRYGNVCKKDLHIHHCNRATTRLHPLAQ